MISYEHGGDIATFAKEQGILATDIIDLSSNINFIRPSSNVTVDMKDLAPYPSYTELYQRLASHFEIDSDEMELFNGASSGIFSLIRFLGKQDYVLYAPLYLEYKKVLERFNYPYTLVNRFENKTYEPKENTTVIFVNPSTPDGTYYDIDKMMKQWMAKNCTIIVDESFLAFTEHKSAKPYLKTYPKLYIITSMTKFYSCAGVRIGALCGSKENIHHLKKYEPLWKLSYFDTQYLLTSLNDPHFTLISKQNHIDAKHYLLHILENSPLIAHIYESSANFVLVKLRYIDAKTLQDKLAPYRIMVRACANFDFLDGFHVRIAVKEISYLKQLEHALKEIHDVL